MLELGDINTTKFIYKLKLANSNEFALNISPKTISWFTDGSCTNNGKFGATAGYAILCVSGYKRNTLIYGKVDDSLHKATNIRAEGIAILNILELLTNDIKSDQWDRSIIYSDSEFWIKMFYNYMPKWQATKFDTMANPDITKQMWVTWNKLKTQKIVEFVHVYAHNKKKDAVSADPFKRFCHDNNALADYLAGIARKLPDNKIRIETV